MVVFVFEYSVFVELVVGCYVGEGDDWFYGVVVVYFE